MSIKITTNHQYRELLEYYDLTEKEQIDNNENEEGLFFRYKECAYCLSDFMVFTDEGEGSTFEDWDASLSESAFSGILVRVDHDCEKIMCGRFYS